jgi:uncharacterized membrane protein YeaQ/YmgE (transglycosylase-associated protein family)
MILGLFALLIVLFVILPLIGVTLWLIISTAVTGLIVGGLGRLVVPGWQPIGLVWTMLLGVGGSMLGTLVGQVFGVGGLATLLLEIAAAAALVAAYGGLGRGRLSGPRRQIGGRV